MIIPVLAPDGHCKMTDDWTPNRRARQPPRRGNSDQILHLINSTV